MTPLTSVESSNKSSLNRTDTQFILVAAITLLAGLLRLYRLGDWSLWGDELISVQRALIAFEDQTVANSPAFPPRIPHLTFSLMNLALTWFGVSEWSARIVPALFGIISIPILYLPIRRIVGPAAALLALLLLALSPWHLYWSQNARFYTSILLFYTLALIAFYVWLEEDRPLYLLISIIMIAIAANERPVALLYVPVIFSYLLLLWILPIQRPSGFRPVYAIVLIAVSVVAALYFGALYFRNWTHWLSTFGWINNNPFWITAGTVYYVGIPIICLGLAGALFLLTQGNRAGLLLGLSALLPLAAIAMISLVQYSANRYIFVSLTGWLILASVSIVALFQASRGYTTILVAGVLVLVLAQPLSDDILYFRYQNGNRDDWKSAFQYVDSAMAPGDVLVTSNSKASSFYSRNDARGLYDLDFDTLTGMEQDVWFVVDMNVPEKEPEKYNWLVNNAQLTATFDVHVQARNFMMRVYKYSPGVDEQATKRLAESETP